MAGDNVLGAYSANKKMADELRQQERLLEKEHMKVLSRIGREKSQLFDTLIRLNVRTPHPETKSTDSERIRLNRVELDSKEVPPKSLSLVPGKKRKTRPKYVTPMIDQTGGDVYCQIQEDTDTRKKLQTDTRTSSLMYKTVNIARSLEALSDRKNKMTDNQAAAGAKRGETVREEREVARLTRSKTFTGHIPETRSGMTLNRAKTIIGTQITNWDTREVKQLSIPRQDTFADDDDVTLSRTFPVDVDPPHLNSFQHLVYFNLRFKPLRPEKQTVSNRRVINTRQSLLSGYVPFRGVPGMTKGWGLKSGRQNCAANIDTRRGADG